MNNRLFATFFPNTYRDEIISDITNKYNILYNKIFVLNLEGSEEQVCTYNIDSNNMSSMINNTIFVHRKKQTNTLYSLNSLNILIKKLNNGVLDKNFPIKWDEYRNCFLLTKNGDLKQIKTSIFEIISL